MIVAVAVVLIAMSPEIYAWGSVGHQVVGLVAQDFINEKGKAYLDRVLRHGETLMNVAPWADIVKHGKYYPHTRPYHYVNINDNPPSKCGYDDDRDCAYGDCTVRAVAGYTDAAMCYSGAKPWQRNHAIKFLTHFLGEITQPLHVTSRDRGGNWNMIKFNGQITNLHSIWDSDILEKRMRFDFDADIHEYAEFLVNRIRYGAYRSASSSWISKYGIKSRNHNGNSLAAIDWAKDSDAYDCSVVWPDYDADPGQDFAYSYYSKVASVVDLQLAKGGYRLADWINKIAETC